MHLLALALIACDPTEDTATTTPDDPLGDDSAIDSGDPVDETGVTWHADVRPVVEQRCSGCHSEGQIAPFTLDDWDDVSVLAPSIVASVESGSMPPYVFDQDCRETDDGVMLSDSERAIFTAWAEGGYAEGDPASYIAPDDVPRTEYPPFDIEVYPKEPFEIDLTELDSYRCMVSDTVTEEDIWAIGSDTILDNAEIVHHTIYYYIPTEYDEQLQALDDASPEPGIDCYGAQSTQWWSLLYQAGGGFGGWTPGTRPWFQDLDSGEPISGQQIPAGVRFVIEGHFNSIAAEGETATDSTGFGIWTLPAGETPDGVLTTIEASTYDLSIPAGAVDHEEYGSGNIRRAGTIVRTNPHMHLLATKMETTLIREDGTEECVTRVDPYDFNWQWTYSYAEHDQLDVSPTDRLEVTCTYDNSAANQPVIDGEQQAPRDVTYGDGTTDEMCINYLTVWNPYED